MPKCGVCGWSFGGWAMTKHAETPCGEESEKAGRVMSSPEVDDYASQIQSSVPERTINDIKREEEESNA
jgi:hypothetical protein